MRQSTTLISAGGAARRRRRATVIRGRTTRGTNRSGTAGRRGDQSSGPGALIKGAAPLAPRLGAVRCRACRERRARVCRDNLNATAAPAPSVASALYAYCAAARAFDGFHLDEGAAADAWLAACPAVARDERPETVAAALVNAERRAIDAGLASKGGHAALAHDAAAILGAGPRAVAAALLDAWACVARHRAAPKRVRRKVRYLACWCGAPVAAAALADAREACLAVRGDDGEARCRRSWTCRFHHAKSRRRSRSFCSDGAQCDYDAPDLRCCYLSCTLNSGALRHGRRPDVKRAEPRGVPPLFAFQSAPSSARTSCFQTGTTRFSSSMAQAHAFSIFPVRRREREDDGSLSNFHLAHPMQSAGLLDAVGPARLPRISLSSCSRPSARRPRT